MRLETGVHVISIDKLADAFLESKEDSVFEFLNGFIESTKKPLLITGKDGLTVNKTSSAITVLGSK